MHLQLLHLLLHLHVFACFGLLVVHVLEQRLHLRRCVFQLGRQRSHATLEHVVSHAAQAKLQSVASGDDALTATSCSAPEIRVLVAELVHRLCLPSLLYFRLFPLPLFLPTSFSLALQQD
jgi:hypothetical protein